MSDWWYGRTWYDRKQNERLEDLSYQVDHQRSEARRLRAQLSSVQGGLEQRLTRLTKAFDAFVELSDIREELRAFQPAVAARHRTRRVLNRLIGTAGSVDGLVLPSPPSPSPSAADPSSELPAYWLPSALAGLVAIVRGEEATTEAEAELAIARDCDATRTDLFLCLALLLTERTDQAAGLLPTLLDLHQDRPVTRAQRELWLAAADGRFGGRGRAIVVERLGALVAGLPDETRAREVEAWRSVIEGIGGARVAVPAFPKPAEPPSDLVAPIRAARQLAALAAWHREAVAAPVSTDEPTSDDDPPDPLYGLLQELVDEGAPEEQPLLIRAAELRRMVEADGGAPPPAPARWHAPAEPPLSLLQADVRSAEPGRRAVAARAGAPLLTAVADRLTAAAAQPLPMQTAVRVGRYTISYGLMGPDQAIVAAAKADAVAAPPPLGNRGTRTGWAMVASACVIVAIGFVINLAGLGVVLGLTAGGIGA
jgi:hypothetical protein